MLFSEALPLILQGQKLTRVGWRTPGMFLFIVHDWTHTGLPQRGDHTRLPCIAMQITDDNVIQWPPVQADILANDWMLV